MERMTVKRKDGRWALANNDGAAPIKQMEKISLAIDRLVAYEDTGMNPNDIKDLRDEFCLLCGKYKIQHPCPCNECKWRKIDG